MTNEQIAYKIHDEIMVSEFSDCPHHCIYEIINLIEDYSEKKDRRRIAYFCCKLDWPCGTIKSVKDYYNLIY
ncbi:MAG: hypothetical protein BV459_09165 [Thermoplasmata archaeon M11B2D]|nr:MAG: hypothetical protein BV459_09165 [Thermoplasmata archaeon M11B2D]